jgi:predicted Kef-type K+ transport protein
MQMLKLLITLIAVTVPDIGVMYLMGWDQAAHLAVVAAWCIATTPLLVLSTQRHRRPEFPRRWLIAALVGSVALGALILGTGWDVRAVVASLLLLPGLTYLLVEGLGLTPRAVSHGPLP